MSPLWRNQLMFTQRTAVIQQGPATTQLMFNHTQRSARQHLKQASSPLNCLSTSFGSVASFSGYTVKKYPSPNIIYQKNTCCISVCHHPQTFNWILYSTKAAPAAWKQEPQQRSRCCLKENQLHHLDAPSQYAFPVTDSVPQSMDRQRWAAFTQVNSIARNHHKKVWLNLPTYAKRYINIFTSAF